MRWAPTRDDTIVAERRNLSGSRETYSADPHPLVKLELPS